MVRRMDDARTLSEAREWVDERLNANQFEQESILYNFKENCARKKRDHLKEIPSDVNYYLNDEYQELLEEERNLKYAKDLLRQII